MSPAARLRLVARVWDSLTSIPVQRLNSDAFRGGLIRFPAPPARTAGLCHDQPWTNENMTNSARSPLKQTSESTRRLQSMEGIRCPCAANNAVLIHGLQRNELNGERGFACNCALSDNGRLQIQLDDGRIILLRPANFEFLSEARSLLPQALIKSARASEIADTTCVSTLHL